jgi:hypothetical protein
MTRGHGRRLPLNPRANALGNGGLHRRWWQWQFDLGHLRGQQHMNGVGGTAGGTALDMALYRRIYPGRLGAVVCVQRGH